MFGFDDVASLVSDAGDWFGGSMVNPTNWAMPSTSQLLGAGLITGIGSNLFSGVNNYQAQQKANQAYNQQLRLAQEQQAMAQGQLQRQNAVADQLLPMAQQLQGQRMGVASELADPAKVTAGIQSYYNPLSNDIRDMVVRQALQGSALAGVSPDSGAANYATTQALTPYAISMQQNAQTQYWNALAQRLGAMGDPMGFYNQGMQALQAPYAGPQGAAATLGSASKYLPMTMSPGTDLSGMMGNAAILQALANRNPYASGVSGGTDTRNIMPDRRAAESLMNPNLPTATGDYSSPYLGDFDFGNAMYTGQMPYQPMIAMR